MFFIFGLRHTFYTWQVEFYHLLSAFQSYTNCEKLVTTATATARRYSRWSPAGLTSLRALDDKLDPPQLEHYSGLFWSQIPMWKHKVRNFFLWCNLSSHVRVLWKFQIMRCVVHFVQLQRQFFHPASQRNLNRISAISVQTQKKLVTNSSRVQSSFNFNILICSGVNGGDWAKKNKTTCCYSLPHLCSAHQSKHGSTRSFSFTSLLHRPANKATQPPPSSASPTSAEWKPGAASFPLLDAVKILEPRLSQWVSVILGSLSGKFICHRCPYTVAPGGRLDTLHWLPLPLSMCPSLSVHISSPSLFLSLPVNISSPSPSLSLSSISFCQPFPPAICQCALHWARTVNRLQ